MKYYIYAHRNTEKSVFYIGKGSGDRLLKTGNRSAFWKRIVAKYGFEAEIISRHETEEDAYTAEVLEIAKHKALGQACANFTLGGDGVRVKARWWGNKISKALSGIKRGSGRDNVQYNDFCSIATLAEMYAGGMSTKEIASQFGVSHTTVWGRLREAGVKIRGNDHHSKSVVCLDTGEVYPSIANAAQSKGVARENLRKVLAGKYKTTGGYRFAYSEGHET